MWNEICKVYSPDSEERIKIEKFCEETGITVEQFKKVFEFTIKCQI